MNKIRKGDDVIVLAGRDKGKRGKVALRKDDSHLVVEGVNVVKKHAKPNPMKGVAGGIMKKPCRSTSPMWPFSMRRLARLIGLVSSCRLMASAFAFTSPAAKKSRWHEHGSFATNLPRKTRARTDRQVWLQVTHASAAL
jgi:hypothetical protein